MLIRYISTSSTFRHFKYVYPVHMMFFSRKFTIFKCVLHQITFTSVSQFSYGVMHFRTTRYVFRDVMYDLLITLLGPLWSWSYDSWIYNYLCNQWLSPLMLWVRISIRARCTTLCNKVCQWLLTGRWFSSGPPVSSNNKSDHHDITEILLKKALNTIKHIFVSGPSASDFVFFVLKVC